MLIFLLLSLIASMNSAGVVIVAYDIKWLFVFQRSALACI